MQLIAGAGDLSQRAVVLDNLHLAQAVDAGHAVDHPEVPRHGRTGNEQRKQKATPARCQWKPEEEAASACGAGVARGHSSTGSYVAAKISGLQG